MVEWEGAVFSRSVVNRFHDQLTSSIKLTLDIAQASLALFLPKQECLM